MNIIDDVSNSAHKAYDKVADAADQANEAMREKGEKLIDAEQKLMKNCRSFVRDNPITALAIASVSGFLLSRLLRLPNSGR